MNVAFTLGLNEINTRRHADCSYIHVHIMHYWPIQCTYVRTTNEPENLAINTNCKLATKFYGKSEVTYVLISLVWVCSIKKCRLMDTYGLLIKLEAEAAEPHGGMVGCKKSEGLSSPKFSLLQEQMEENSLWFLHIILTHLIWKITIIETKNL